MCDSRVYSQGLAVRAAQTEHLINKQAVASAEETLAYYESGGRRGSTEYFEAVASLSIARKALARVPMPSLHTQVVALQRFKGCTVAEYEWLQRELLLHLSRCPGTEGLVDAAVFQCPGKEDPYADFIDVLLQSSWIPEAWVLPFMRRFCLQDPLARLPELADPTHVKCARPGLVGSTLLKLYLRRVQALHPADAFHQAELALAMALRLVPYVPTSAIEEPLRDPTVFAPAMVTVLTTHLHGLRNVCPATSTIAPADRLQHLRSLAPLQSHTWPLLWYLVLWNLATPGCGPIAMALVKGMEGRTSATVGYQELMSDLAKLLANSSRPGLSLPPRRRAALASCDWSHLVTVQTPYIFLWDLVVTLPHDAITAATTSTMWQTMREKWARARLTEPALDDAIEDARRNVTAMGGLLQRVDQAIIDGLQHVRDMHLYTTGRGERGRGAMMGA